MLFEVGVEVVDARELLRFTAGHVAGEGNRLKDVLNQPFGLRPHERKKSRDFF